jgi:peptidoglycan-associated lipoprotein
VKIKQTALGILIMIFLASSLFLLSCSKKELQPEGVASKSSAAGEDEAEKAKKKVRVKEQEPKIATDQELREKALKEEEARRAKEAALEAQRAKAEEARRMKEMAEKARFESDDIYFEFDQYILSDKAKQTLNNKVLWLKDFPSAKALIEGHCDERGSVEYNLALGQKRADAAMKYLVSMGIDAKRISTISFGKEKPMDPGHTEEAWAKNRRTHFVLK